MSTVLIVDDEPGVRESMSLILKIEGYKVDTVRDAVNALKVIDSSKKYDFIICDMKMPVMDGLEFLTEFKNREKDSIVIMISAYGTIDSSIKAIKYGASDYISKPVNIDELILRMKMSEERKKLRKENVALKKELRKEFGFEDIIYKDEKMKRIIELASKVSDYKTTVLITGESGTGKELIARSIHTNSSRKNKPFVALNCAAIPENLLESELFGHTKGAFTGAIRDRKGRFETADGGTIFLDEIGDISLRSQLRLLRIVQEGEYERVGDSTPLKCDVRIIAATNQSLPDKIAAGEFREDLYYRLNVVRIEVPPRREYSIGLSGRYALGDRGMLFHYDEERQGPFWMKNTHINLAIAFIDAQFRIVEIREMVADSLDLVTPASPYRYAVEAASGWYAERGIEAGDRARFRFELPEQ